MDENREQSKLNTTAEGEKKKWESKGEKKRRNAVRNY